MDRESTFPDMEVIMVYKEGQSSKLIITRTHEGGEKDEKIEQNTLEQIKVQERREIEKLLKLMLAGHKPG